MKQITIVITITVLITLRDAGAISIDSVFGLHSQNGQYALIWNRRSNATNEFSVRRNRDDATWPSLADSNRPIWVYTPPDVSNVHLFPASVSDDGHHIAIVGYNPKMTQQLLVLATDGQTITNIWFRQQITNGVSDGQSSQLSVRITEEAAIVERFHCGSAVIPSSYDNSDPPLLAVIRTRESARSRYRFDLTSGRQAEEPEALPDKRTVGLLLGGKYVPLWVLVVVPVAGASAIVLMATIMKKRHNNRIDRYK